MRNDRAKTAWNVDLTARLASRGNASLSFSRCGQGLKLAFVTGGDGHLEDQCIIAGEAADAIRASLRLGGDPIGC